MTNFTQGIWSVFSFEIFNSYGLGVFAGLLVLYVLIRLVCVLAGRILDCL